MWHLPFLWLSVLLFLCGPTWAGPEIRTLDTPNRLIFSGFSSALSALGDVNGDAIPDYVVGAYEQTWDENNHQGRAFVFDGQTGKLLLELDNPHPQADAAFGFAVAAAGDVNQDGVPDCLIGAFGQGEAGNAETLVFGWTAEDGSEHNVSKRVGSGQVFVFSGRDGQLLHSLEAPRQSAGAGFGWSVASAGDLNGDGIPEPIVGAHGQDHEGRAFVFHGRDGTLLHTLVPPSDSGAEGFGWTVNSAGDLNRDGTPDIIVGAPYSSVEGRSTQGRAYVYSGTDGSLLYPIEHPPPQAGASFGWHVTPAGDLNEDGVPDLLIGAPYQDVGAVAAQGAAFAFSGTDGSLLLTFRDPVPRPAAGFGWIMSAIPDVNMDEVPEILVSAPFQKVDEFYVQGEVFLYNGRDGRHLITFDNPYPHQGSMFGYALASPGDINADDIPEFVFGAPGQHIRDKPAVGRAFLFVSQR